MAETMNFNGQNLATIQKALKENYLPAWRNQLGIEPTALLGKVGADTFGKLLLHTLQKLLALHGVDRANTLEVLGGKGGNGIKLKLLAGGTQSVADGEDAGIEHADDIAGVGFLVAEKIFFFDVGGVVSHNSVSCVFNNKLSLVADPVQIILQNQRGGQFVYGILPLFSADAGVG
mgnify:CR=1 FL=1